MKKLNLVLAFIITFSMASFAQKMVEGKPYHGNFRGSYARIPGAIQAEYFDEGGEGVAFHNEGKVQYGDDDYRKAGMAFRNDSTEIEIAYGTTMLAAMREGDWFQYTVEVLQDATYEIDFVTSGWKRGSEAAKIRLECDGHDLCKIDVPYTARWQDFTTTTLSGFKLTKGIHVLRAYFTNSNDNVNVDLYRFRKMVNNPFNGIYNKVPGLIEAEDFDEGVEGVAFHNEGEVSNGNATEGPRFAGLQYRKTPVELAKEAGTMMITAVRPNEWWKYILEVDHDGVYDIEISASRWDPNEKDGIISFEIEGNYKVEYKSDSIRVPYSGKWCLFKTIKIPGVKLKKGIKQMKVLNEKGYEVINLDSYRFTEITQ